MLYHLLVTFLYYNIGLIPCVSDADCPEELALVMKCINKLCELVME
ncbi:Nodule Cysteine-Rich (NCR) secreted peptide [Medicago truncatula]|uniref:Nodule Cysteine-Rich (NCR) secreted peptide n=1 Tax=Medicago truncatula TaxID=3880 RepID=A0A072ULV0_MEDTR|nr:Nodule Cysteine-Rich (NCR) secreted peptide [Medicago truncatula]